MDQFNIIEECNAEEDKRSCIVLSICSSGCMGPSNMVRALGVIFIAVEIGLMRYDVFLLVLLTGLVSYT